MCPGKKGSFSFIFCLSGQKRFVFLLVVALYSQQAIMASTCLNFLTQAEEGEFGVAKGFRKSRRNQDREETIKVRLSSSVSVEQILAKTRFLAQSEKHTN